MNVAIDNAMGRRHGFTLIELMMTLAVAAVLAAIALPSFGGRLERERVRLAAEELAADVAEARFEAAQSGRPLYLQVNAGPAWCWSVATAADCSCGSRQPCQLRAVGPTEHPKVRLLQGVSLRMDATGTPQAAPAAQAAVLETSRGEQIAVQISALGRARVCARTAAAWRSLPAC